MSIELCNYIEMEKRKLEIQNIATQPKIGITRN